MKSTLLVFAAVFTLGACASVTPATTGGSAQVAANKTYYCWKDKLSTEGSTLACNWETNTNDACRSYNSSTLAKTNVAAGPADAKRCENGQWLVMVTTK
jgi:uncharacterized protein YceK